MSVAQEKVEAVIISGPDRGRIIEVPADVTDSISDREIAMLNEALDKVLASLDRFEAQIDRTIRVFEEQARRNMPPLEEG